MNQLLLKELPAQGTAFSVTGGRAVHIRTVLRSKVGDSLKVGLLNGNTGHAVIRSIEKDQVILDSFVLEKPAPPMLPITLAVALPRPQSLKKVLHFAASAGIPELVLFQSARVEKSYWNSSVLQPDNLDSELFEGLEQGCGTKPPAVSFFRSFKDFIAASNSDYDNYCKIVAHPVPEHPFSEKPEAEKILLTVGPEGGFLPSEVAAFQKNGFLKFSCGNHILRVEFACAYLCGMMV